MKTTERLSGKSNGKGGKTPVKAASASPPNQASDEGRGRVAITKMEHARILEIDRAVGQGYHALGQLRARAAREEASLIARLQEAENSLMNAVKEVAEAHGLDVTHPEKVRWHFDAQAGMFERRD